MDIDAASWWKGQDRRVQNPTECRDGNQIRSPSSKTLQEIRSPYFERLQKWNPSPLRHFFHRRRRQGMPTAFGAIRLGDHPDDFIIRLQQRLKRWDGKLRR